MAKDTQLIPGLRDGPITPEEKGYRRGAHQAAGFLLAHPELRATDDDLRRFVRILREMRGSTKPYSLLLHNALEKFRP